LEVDKVIATISWLSFLAHPVYLALCHIQGGTILGAPTEIIPLGQSELPYDVFLSYLEELSQNTFRCVVVVSFVCLFSLRIFFFSA